MWEGPAANRPAPTGSSARPRGHQSAHPAAAHGGQQIAQLGAQVVEGAAVDGLAVPLLQPALGSGRVGSSGGVGRGTGSCREPAARRPSQRAPATHQAVSAKAQLLEPMGACPGSQIKWGLERPEPLPRPADDVGVQLDAAARYQARQAGHERHEASAAARRRRSARWPPAGQPKLVGPGRPGSAWHIYIHSPPAACAPSHRRRNQDQERSHQLEALAALGPALDHPPGCTPHGRLISTACSVRAPARQP